MDEFLKALHDAPAEKEAPSVQLTTKDIKVLALKAQGRLLEHQLEELGFSRKSLPSEV
ncbi:hypothetical protein [Azotobacter salinestris]|uniref:hypothetical protein n=1 Tax=Azotobacter salinestris TaxID=69964 RepID=UPI0032DF01A5